MRRWMFVVTMSLMVGAWIPTSSVSAQAKKTKAAKNAVKVGNRYYRKKTVISFGNDTIQGDLTRPDGEYIESRRNIKLGGLIQLREHWKKRILQAVNDL
ncbi:MAG: hypothetical protein EP343_02490 [Deltaproteobacteria bacterium]|nr:MAG: hypothetical protein EP343_02490 [Deltaproteobacteria bacterium]